MGLKVNSTKTKYIFSSKNCTQPQLIQFLAFDVVKDIVSHLTFLVHQETPVNNTGRMWIGGCGWVDVSGHKCILCLHKNIL